MADDEADDKAAADAERPRRRAKAQEGRQGRKKEEAKKAGFAANIEEGLEVKPARLKLRYRKEIVPALMKELGLQEPQQVPRLEKIVVNMGLGEALANNKILESAVDQLAAITGQKPSSPARASRSRTSSSARDRRSAPRSRCATTGCTSSSTA